MLGATNEGVSGTRRLVLGFDGGCITCSELARKIEERVGDKIEVRSLRHPQLLSWREQTLKKNLFCVPTLFEIDGEEARAWTGWCLGLVLSRSLGPSDTWKVMKVLGEMNALSKAEDLPAARIVGEITRGQFLKGVGGAAVTMSLLSTMGTFSSIAMAQDGSFTAESKRLTASLRKLGPYVRFQQDRTIVIDVKSAKRASIDESSIKIAGDMVELNNEILASKSLTASSSEIERLQKKFEPMFKGVANGRNPEAYLAQSGDITALAKACGGNRNNPHPCPSRRSSGNYFRSERDLRSHLGYTGFVETPGWASGYAPIDYTKVTPAYGCNNGPFRVQAYGYRSGSRWTYWTQNPEPNPVVNRYRWPAWWWGSYVRWWHREYC